MTHAAGFLARASWLDAPRARIYGAMLAATVALGAASFAWRLSDVFATPAHWRPDVSDFGAFWSAAHFAATGHPAQAYDPAAMQAAQAIGGGQAGTYLPYRYPPPFLLFTLPLGLLPFPAALLLFMAAGYAAALLVLRRLLPPPWPLFPILAFPPLMLNTAIGQTGSLATLCFAGAALAMGRRPALAGACLGCLVCKPHLALFVPVALAAARRGRALLGCAAAAGALCLLSWLVLGAAAWRGFFASLPANARMEGSEAVWFQSLSTYAGLRTLGAGAGFAVLAQTSVAAGALLLLAWACARRPGPAWEIGLLVCATLLALPHVLDYDLVTLGIPLCCLAGAATRAQPGAGWRDWEKITASLAYAWPLAARNLTRYLHLPLTPLVLAGLLAVLAGRALDRPQA